MCNLENPGIPLCFNGYFIRPMTNRIMTMVEVICERQKMTPGHYSMLKTKQKAVKMTGNKLFLSDQ